MTRLLLYGFVVLFLSNAVGMSASAHDVPWRAGEPRTIGFGHCAKGACTKRVYWGKSKPHRHVGGKVVFDRIVSRLSDRR